MLPSKAAKGNGGKFASCLTCQFAIRNQPGQRCKIPSGNQGRGPWFQQDSSLHFPFWSPSSYPGVRHGITRGRDWLFCNTTTEGTGKQGGLWPGLLRSPNSQDKSKWMAPSYCCKLACQHSLSAGIWVCSGISQTSVPYISRLVMMSSPQFFPDFPMVLLGLLRFHFLSNCRHFSHLWGFCRLGYEVSKLRLQALHDLASIHVLPQITIHHVRCRKTLGFLTVDNRIYMEHYRWSFFKW